jgi:hypothetical protein
MSKRNTPMDEPIYFHKGQPVLTKLGTIMGRSVFVELAGDEERREQDYIRITHMLQELFYPKDDAADPANEPHISQ